MSFRPDTSSELFRSFSRPQCPMALPAQPDFDPGAAVPPIAPQRESSQLSDQPVLPTPNLGSKGAKKPRERWTAEEHERFLAGLKMFHRDWKSIEKHVGTKTAVQIRSHAQKFFAKAEREPGTVDFQLPPPRPKRKPATATNAPSRSGASYGMSETAAAAVQLAVSQPNVTGATNLLGELLPDAIPGVVRDQPELMSKIAAAAIAAASTTAHAVITAAGPEYLQVIQELAKHDQRLSFLACPLTDLVSTFSMQPRDDAEPSEQRLSMSGAHAAPVSSCPMAMPIQTGAGLRPKVSTSMPHPCVSPVPATHANPAGSGSGFPGMSPLPEPPAQLLNQLLSVPPASSQLLSEHLPNADLARPRERLDIYGTLPPSTTGVTSNILLSRFNDSNTPETVTHAVPPLATFTAPTTPLPRMGIPDPTMQDAECLQRPPYSAVEEPLHAVSMLLPSPPVSGQVQSTQHAIPAPVPYRSTHGVTESQAVQLVQAQQLNQQHVFPKQQGEQIVELAAATNGYGSGGGTNGYGQQGSGGGSGGNSGGDMNQGSGDKSGSKSAKQSGNPKPGQQELLEALPINRQGSEAASDCLPLGPMMDMPLLQPQGRLNSQQRAEFYKQYYQEMIRRGAEGLRNMNVEFGTNDLAGMGPDGAPHAGVPAPDAAAFDKNLALGVGLPAERRPECVPEAHGWTGRKKQRTADTSDMQKAALSNACKQPVAILGMVPCPPEGNIVPLEDGGRRLELHKGTGWAIEVEQQDTATSAQGHSRGEPGTSRNTHPDTSHKLQTSPAMAHPEVCQAMNASTPGPIVPNSSGEGSNEPGEGCIHNEDGPGDDAKPGLGDEAPAGAAAPPVKPDGMDYKQCLADRPHSLPLRT